MSFQNKNLLLVLNPVAGKGKGKKICFETVELLTKHGYRVTVLPTEHGTKTEETIAKEAVNYEKIVAVGGDGTLNNVVNGLLKSQSDAPLGYIPLGSTNDFAYSLGLPKKITEACERIANDEPRFIDIGSFGDRNFVYIACTGMFAEASYMTSQQLKNTIGHSAYLLKGLFSLKDTKKMQYNVTADGAAFEGEFLFCAVSNTLRAGGVVSLPKSDVEFDDGFFELTMIKAPKKISDGTGMVSDLIHNHLDTDNFVRCRARNFKIEVEQESGWSLDGENGGNHNSVSIEIKEKALRFIY